MDQISPAEAGTSAKSDRSQETGKALDLAERTTGLTSDGSTKNNPLDLKRLSLAAAERYALAGNWRDLEDAIKFAKLALASPHLESAAACELGHGLADLLALKYRETKATKDLQDTLEVSRRSVVDLPPHSELRGPRLNRHLQILKEFILDIHNASEVEDALKHLDGFFLGHPSDPANLWTRTNQQLVTDCLSRKYEVSGHPYHLVQLLMQAIKWWDGSADPSAPHVGEPTLQESKRMPFLVDKISKLAAAAQDDSSVIQITNAFHREYVKRLKTLGPRRALLSLL
ncbi:hypothetical protein B0T14DRAFT_150489 [Immersiella caudata]|uniref:Uncharacterized protein n=1 Tax=Immersiella caudata TaxID=314043 RepID=A0AA40C2N1_9PEZI|nr:hypothetical protein B0T14DRAFT_150489 [Immersiella caudata]